MARQTRNRISGQLEETLDTGARIGAIQGGGQRLKLKEWPDWQPGKRLTQARTRLVKRLQ
jgi:hypothetical protein